MESFAYLNQYLHLDPDTNKLYWKQDMGNYKAGDEAGSYRTDGYYYSAVQINNESHCIHRVIWILHNRQDIPENYEVDHIDGDKSNLLPDNLRICTHAQNTWNRKKPAHNTSGVKGVTYEKDRDMWRGGVMVNGKHYRQRFHSKEQAESFVIGLRNQLHGEFANHGNDSTKGSTSPSDSSRRNTCG